jgi:hypothetical protein
VEETKTSAAALIKYGTFPPLKSGKKAGWQQNAVQSTSSGKMDNLFNKDMFKMDALRNINFRRFLSSFQGRCLPPQPESCVRLLPAAAAAAAAARGPPASPCPSSPSEEEDSGGGEGRGGSAGGVCRLLEAEEL